MNVKNKTVLITGSSSGIGAATAKLFAKEGAKVVVNCKSNIKGAEAVVKQIKKAKGKAIAVQADISKQDDVDRLFSETKKAFGEVDILINNAGTARGKAFLDTTYEDWVNEFDDNLFGTVLCSQKAAKSMLKKKSGKILNTSSIRGLSSTGREGIMPYSASKAAVVNFTKTLAKELGPNIQVNAIAPGFVYTPNYDKAPDKVKKGFIDGTIIKRWIDVEEIAEAFLFLAKADAVTGQVIVVDGGFTLKVA